MGNRHALIIANSSYRDGKLASLHLPGSRFPEFSALLMSNKAGAFDKVETLSNPTCAGVLQSLEIFCSKKGPDDFLLVYFCGHGILDSQGELFLALGQTEHARLGETALMASVIGHMLDNSPSAAKLVILDCCYSSISSPDKRPLPGAGIPLSRIFAGGGLPKTILSASDAVHYVWRGEDLLGRYNDNNFTGLLTQGLTVPTAKSGPGEFRTVEEWFAWVIEACASESTAYQPVCHKVGGTVEIPISRDASFYKKAEGLPLVRHALVLDAASSPSELEFGKNNAQRTENTIENGVETKAEKRAARVAVFRKLKLERRVAFRPAEESSDLAGFYEHPTIEMKTPFSGPEPLVKAERPIPAQPLKDETREAIRLPMEDLLTLSIEERDELSLRIKEAKAMRTPILNMPTQPFIEAGQKLLLEEPGAFTSGKVIWTCFAVIPICLMIYLGYKGYKSNPPAENLPPSQQKTLVPQAPEMKPSAAGNEDAFFRNSIKEALDRHQPSMRRIYYRYVATTPGFKGNLKLRLEIFPNGGVRRVSIVNSSTANQRFDHEILATVKTWTFHPFQGSTNKMVTLPLQFQ